MAVPRAHLLSNGRYRVLLTDAGGGYSSWQDTALTRWNADRTQPTGGFLFYVRDLERPRTWSAGLEPMVAVPGAYSIESVPGRVRLIREYDGIESRLDVVVATGHDAELRALTLINQGRTPRWLDVTTYLEVALNDQTQDALHPAFSKLFIQTEALASHGTVLARRRLRSPDEPSRWMGLHLFVLETGEHAAELETDRVRFIGRGRTLEDPAALDPGALLSGTVGDVLDPILSLRRRLVLPPGESAQLVAVLAAGAQRQDVVERLDHVATTPVPNILHDAGHHARAALDALGLAPQTDHIPALSGALLFSPSPPFGLNAPDLTSLGLTERASLIVATVQRVEDRPELEALARLVGWWRGTGLAVDLVVIEDGIATGTSIAPAGGVTVRSASAIPPELRRLLERRAQLTLARMRDREVPSVWPPVAAPDAHATPDTTPLPADGPPPAGEALTAFNGYGGFAATGAEYVVQLAWKDGRLGLPPRPWTNVIANETTGCVVSERGAGYTWNENSRENRLTPWGNDPVIDPTGEALYLRDEETGRCWSPTPSPLPGPAGYEARHGFGYSVWTHVSHELQQVTTTFVPRHDTLRLTSLLVTNVGDRPRRLSLYAYFRWVLGELPARASRLVVTEHDRATGAILAVSSDRGVFASRVAFACLVAPSGTDGAQHTGDRTGFLGCLGNERRPAAVLAGATLDGRTGAELDPCAAFRARLTLDAGATLQCTVLLGEAESREAAYELCRRYRTPDAVSEALAMVRRFWQDVVGRLQVTTPAPDLDLMLNGWLTYQNLSCRVWGRSAFYQSGGALGFRDQLQDSVALVWLMPSLTRSQILLHASQQFPEGDVLHWWHPPLGKGLRTRFADDPLWLPFAVTEYIRHTGDTTVLDEPIRFLDDRPLAPGEDYALLTPHPVGPPGTVYEHCCRSLDRSLARGAHGLPLMGCGDWNDGMNRVGSGGRGESVWLGFFLYELLQRCIPVCERRGDVARAARYRTRLNELAAAVNDGGWDGAWYRRAYYDDGEPLGSAASDEGRIDAIAQAWAVLSGAAPAERAERALDALERYLVDETAGIIRLLTPPFDRTPHDPGYIKGYLPGVRENGGQYTHGTLWAVRALAELGRTERAAALLEMLGPVYHTRTPRRMEVYQAEPYVVAADVYGVAPHVGRAGWTWYTGSAGWMYRVGIESVLGLSVREGASLVLRPCIPSGWPGYSVRYRAPGSGATYEIAVRQEQPRPAKTIARLDDTPLAVREGAVWIPLDGEGARHQVEVTLGADVGPHYRPRLPSERLAD